MTADRQDQETSAEWRTANCITVDRRGVTGKTRVGSSRASWFLQNPSLGDVFFVLNWSKFNELIFELS